MVIKGDNILEMLFLFKDEKLEWVIFDEDLFDVFEGILILLFGLLDVSEVKNDDCWFDGWFVLYLVFDMLEMMIVFRSVDCLINFKIVKYFKLVIKLIVLMFVVVVEFDYLVLMLV